MKAIETMDELKLMLQSIAKEYGDKIRNVPRNDYSRLNFLPINDTASLKEFDKNLARDDPVNEELKTQFVRPRFYIIYK